MPTLYFAPDNASLVIRIVLEELGMPFDTVLVDRSVREQESTAMRRACADEGIAAPFILAPTPPDGSRGTAV